MRVEMNDNIVYVGISVIIRIKRINTNLKLDCRHQICWKKGKNQIKTK